MAAYHKVFEIDPQNSMALYNKALVLAKLGKDDELIKAYQRAIETKASLEACTKKVIFLNNKYNMRLNST